MYVITTFITIAAIAVLRVSAVEIPESEADFYYGGRGSHRDHWDASSNMNSYDYKVANAMPGKDSVGFRGEYFEVYSPVIKSQYSQVAWKVLDPVPLPKDIVARYANKIMAVTGQEVNVVRRTAKPDGTYEEESVPCYQSYNHHYVSYLYGAGLKVEDQTISPGHGEQVKFVGERRRGVGGVPHNVPAVQAFSEHNGNEARQTYHGLPSGIVQPIQSPEYFVFGPMQINTLNPDGSGTRGGPLPKSSQAPQNASYSGILECPCSTRRVKKFDEVNAVFKGACADNKGFRAEQDCFAAVVDLGVYIVSNTTINSVSAPSGCFLQPSGLGYSAVFNENQGATGSCNPGPAGDKTTFLGRFDSLVDLSVELDGEAKEVILTIAGPADAWFGVAFNATAMADLPWSIIVEGDRSDASKTVVSERKLGDHNGGSELSPVQVKVLSSIVANGTRTVRLTRSFVPVDGDRFLFTAAPALLPFLNAIGGTPQFDGNVHKQQAGAEILIMGGNTTACMCHSNSGSIDGVPFRADCYDEPYSDLIKQHNPTCDFSAYRGGLSCCRDGNFLLDAGQKIPDPVDEVYYKWRFYYEDWNPQNQTAVDHIEWQFGHIEYDVPKAPEGTPPQDAVHVLTTRFQGITFASLTHPGCDPFKEYYCLNQTRFANGGMHMIMTGGHCHAPACLGIELYNEDTGDLWCHIEPVGGKGDDPFDEEGYLWLPPCQWSFDPSDGLPEPPVFQIDTNFTAIKRVNSTYGHTGVMAIFQGRASYVN